MVEPVGLQPTFDIVYEDADYVAINKPAGVLVHRTRISADRVFVLQLLRDQLGYRVYPIHRLDRATSGVLIFGKHPEAARALGLVFQGKGVEKKYLAVVRGYVDAGCIDYPLADPELGQEAQPALTHYRCLRRSEIPHAIGLKYATARFSLVEVNPETGRRHQIRKHFAHIFHPIIGDMRHGDNKHNTYFRDRLGLECMLLHACSLAFVHPVHGLPVRIGAAYGEAFSRGLVLCGLDAALEVGPPLGF